MWGMQVAEGEAVEGVLAEGPQQDGKDLAETVEEPRVVGVSLDGETLAGGELPRTRHHALEPTAAASLRPRTALALSTSSCSHYLSPLALFPCACTANSPPRNRPHQV